MSNDAEPFVLKLDDGRMVYHVKSDDWTLSDESFMHVDRIDASAFKTIREFKQWGQATILLNRSTP